MSSGRVDIAADLQKLRSIMGLDDVLNDLKFTRGQVQGTLRAIQVSGLDFKEAFQSTKVKEVFDRDATTLAQGILKDNPELEGLYTVSEIKKRLKAMLPKIVEKDFRIIDDEPNATTQAKQRASSAINFIKQRFNAPLYAIRWELTTGLEENKQGTWKGWRIKPFGGALQDALIPPGSELFNTAKDLREMFTAGRVRTVEETPDGGYEPGVDEGTDY